MFKMQEMDECLIETCRVNLTRNWSREIPFSTLRGFDIFYWTCDALIILLGIPLNIGIIHYEWFGGDSQKRSLSNRMMSSFIMANCVAGTIKHIFTGIVR